MWKKDGNIYNGGSIIIDNKRVFNPSEELLKAAGYVWEEPASFEPVEVPELVAIEAEFEDACIKFKSICADIGVLIDDPDFKGGFDEMADFENNPAAATSEGLALSVKWIAADKLCTYLASKLGIGQPAWWYRCWEAELNYAQPDSTIQEESAFEEVEDLTLSELEL